MSTWQTTLNPDPRTLDLNPWTLSPEPWTLPPPPPQIYVHSFPQFHGVSFGDVALSFPDAIPVGVVERTTGYVLCNPAPTYRLSPDEDLVRGGAGGERGGDSRAGLEASKGWRLGSRGEGLGVST